MNFAGAQSKFGSWFWRVVPIATFIVALSYVLSVVIVQPRARLVKVLVLLLVMILIWRFAMIYSLYVFLVLFLFPSGVALNSTNVVLMTLMFLLWLVRARSGREKLFTRTEIDAAVALLVMASLLSFINVEGAVATQWGLRLLWRQLTAIAFFYLIVRFVDDEKKLETMTKFMCVSAGLLALTAVIELMAPGQTLIPGWISFRKTLGAGELGYRLKGLRLGGAVASHSILSDYCSLTLFFMVFYFMRSKNPLGKVGWFIVAAMSGIAMMATANRGAAISFLVGFVYVLWVFRRSFSPTKYILVISSFVAAYVVGEMLLKKYTLAASVTQRILGTYFVGFVPEARVGTWDQALTRSFEHIFVGHGLAYGQEFAGSLEAVLWPHNAYLYYLYTIGLLGLGSFLIILYKLFRITLRYSQRQIEKTFAGKIMGLLHVSLVMFMLEQMRTDHQRTTDNVYIYIVWMLFGLVVATGKIATRRAKSIDTSAPDRRNPSFPILPE